MNMPSRYTYSDYKRFEGDWKLIDGFLYAITPNSFGKHQGVKNLIRVFDKELESCKCDIYPKNENTVVRPDLGVYCKYFEKYPKITSKIVIEIVNDSTANKDEKIKFEIYEKEKVDYYVLVYPDFENKVSNNKNGFDKVYEEDGKYKFDLCNIEIDFKRVFK